MTRIFFAHDFREEFLGRSYSLFVPPTVITELGFFASREDISQHDAAHVALEKLISWKCSPLTLSSTQLVIASCFATRLIESHVIPDHEQNDGKILGQTSLAKIPLLVTSDKHLLDADEDALLLAFNEADMLPVHPSHPKKLLRALR